MTKLGLPLPPKKTHTNREVKKSRDEQDLIHRRALVLTRPNWVAVMAPIVAAKKKRKADRAVEQELVKKAKAEEKKAALAQKRRNATNKSVFQTAKPSGASSRSGAGAKRSLPPQSQSAIQPAQPWDLAQAITPTLSLLYTCLECKVPMAVAGVFPTCATMHGWRMCATCYVWHCTACCGSSKSLQHNPSCLSK